MDYEVKVVTGRKEFDSFYPKIRSFLEKDTLDVCVDGVKIRGYRSPDAKSIWIRDYSDILRGVMYHEKDVFSVINHFAETQAANGRIFDYFTTYPEKLPCERENWTKYVRVPVEADVEYRFVKAVYLAWQATGDDTWLWSLVPAVENALNYSLSHPQRWCKELGLLKRPYTIDTWDFAYTAGKHNWLQFQINEDTYWGIMHGDNSGLYEAIMLLSRIYEVFDSKAKAEAWADKAGKIKENTIKHCWNGKFFTHFVKLNPCDIPGIDEASQLSLSNPININRGLTNWDQSRSIIHEYIKRGKDNKAFADWFSIDPPFPDGSFGDEKLIAGSYINGGIFPMVGGELALAALKYAFEEYGIGILKQYHQMISESGETYLWYFPDGKASSVDTSTSPDATPSDGWGASSMLNAFIKGLLGVDDVDKCFRKIVFSPAWFFADIQEAHVDLLYAASGAGFSYDYRQDENQMHYEIKTDWSDLYFKIGIPKKTTVRTVKIDGKTVPFSIEKKPERHYLQFNEICKTQTKIIIQFENLKTK